MHVSSNSFRSNGTIFTCTPTVLKNTFANTRASIDSKVERYLGKLECGRFRTVHKVLYDGAVAALKRGLSQEGQIMTMFAFEGQVLEYVKGVGGCPRLLAAAHPLPRDVPRCGQKTKKQKKLNTLSIKGGLRKELLLAIYTVLSEEWGNSMS